jgi:ABC-type glycerol-3-phosphate transport system substrate-binding protein
MVDFKGMTRKKKFEYIKEYYKFHIIIGIIVIVLLGSFIKSQITKVNYVFNLTVIGSTVKSDKTVVVKNPTKKQSAEIDNIPIQTLTGSSDGNAYQFMQKIMAEVSANALDLVIISKGDYDSFVKNGMFYNLDKIKNSGLYEYKDIFIQGVSEDGEKGTFAVNIENSKVLKDYGMDTTDKVACIVSSSKEKEKALKALKWILGS